MKIKKIVVIVLIVFIVILLIQNVQVITLRFLFWKISMSRIIFIPLVLIIGFILGYLFAKISKKNK
jgi:putative membrane protein